ncbi:hypothetical protein 16Q_123 [Pseudomonas phage 16Q]|nr:hypothetical protein 16Q_123 [Pseudomonas phage 16Q]
MTEQTITEVARASLGYGVDLVELRHKGVYNYNNSPYNYTRKTLEGLSGNDLFDLAKLADILNNLPEEGALDLDAGQLEQYIKNWASETAEGAEVPFTFTDGSGRTQTYSPASLWEASGSCSEWEQSAQEGYDYGWDL